MMTNIQFSAYNTNHVFSRSCTIIIIIFVLKMTMIRMMKIIIIVYFLGVANYI